MHLILLYHTNLTSQLFWLIHFFEVFFKHRFKKLIVLFTSFLWCYHIDNNKCATENIRLLILLNDYIWINIPIACLCMETQQVIHSCIVYKRKSRSHLNTTTGIGGSRLLTSLYIGINYHRISHQSLLWDADMSTQDP